MKDVRAKKDPDRCGTSQGHFGRLYSCLRTLWAGSRAPREGILEKHRWAARRRRRADAHARIRPVVEISMHAGSMASVRAADKVTAARLSTFSKKASRKGEIDKNEFEEKRKLLGR
jgi:hypothetical protein